MTKIKAEKLATMTAFYHNCQKDTELRVGVDEDGIVRTRHGATAEANKEAVAENHAKLLAVESKIEHTTEQLEKIKGKKGPQAKALRKKLKGQLKGLKQDARELNREIREDTRQMKWHQNLFEENPNRAGYEDKLLGNVPVGAIELKD